VSRDLERANYKKLEMREIRQDYDKKAKEKRESLKRRRVPRNKIVEESNRRNSLDENRHSESVVGCDRKK